MSEQQGQGAGEDPTIISQPASSDYPTPPLDSLPPPGAAAQPRSPAEADRLAHEQADGFSKRPELYVAGAFAGAFALAKLLGRLAGSGR